MSTIGNAYRKGRWQIVWARVSLCGRVKIVGIKIVGTCVRVGKPSSLGGYLFWMFY